MDRQIRQILDLFAQPVFWAQEGTVTWRNSAACPLLAEGASLAAVLGGAHALFLRWTREGVLQIPTTLNGAAYDLTALATDGGDLFVAARRGEDQDSAANAVLSAAASLRKTLHAMLPAAETLFSQTEEPKNPAASRLNQSIYQMIRLSNQLSKSGQLLLHQQSAHREPMDIKAFLDDFIYQSRPLVESCGLTLEYIPLPTATRADADPALLELALYNLLSNAMHYTPRGGTVTICAEKQGRTAFFSVSDNGEGISQEVISTLFSRFSSQKVGDSRWGLGLGLPIVREVASLHGGSMTVDTADARGVRVTFSVSLEPTVLSLRSPMIRYDNYGSFHHGLVELSDVLDAEMFDPREV